MSRIVPLILLLLTTGCQRPDERVVVYSAQDRDFAEHIFTDFERSAGLKVAAKFDTEASKSVSLVVDIESESQRPRCDLHWNNEILGTIRLARQGLYEPYASPMAEPMPEWSRPPDRCWQAFAARARVLIVNTQLVRESDYPKSILDLTDPKWRGRVAMAKPLFGTTATHAACLFESLGSATARQFFQDLHTNQVQIASGNKNVATGVSSGQFAMGLTDTDDAIIEVLAGKPVAIVFLDREASPRHPRLGVLFIPNTLALVKKSPHPAGAKKLIDYLLKPETEAMLAKGGGYQIPLNPNVKADLPKGILTPSQVKVMDVNFSKAADRWEESQAFLKELFAR